MGMVTSNELYKSIKGGNTVKGKQNFFLSLESLSRCVFGFEFSLAQKSNWSLNSFICHYNLAEVKNCLCIEVSVLICCV